MSKKLGVGSRCESEAPTMNDNDLYQTTINLLVLGYVIRRLREAKKLTLRDLADLARDDDRANATDPSFISLIERGERVMSYQVLKGLANALEVDPKWLITLALPVHQLVQGTQKRKFAAVARKQFDKLTLDIQEVLAKELFGVTVDSLVKDFVEHQRTRT
jgi:transcriptional regulator with XRE-family HTH domain